MSLKKFLTYKIGVTCECERWEKRAGKTAIKLSWQSFFHIQNEKYGIGHGLKAANSKLALFSPVYPHIYFFSSKFSPMFCCFILYKIVFLTCGPTGLLLILTILIGLFSNNSRFSQSRLSYGSWFFVPSFGILFTILCN